MADPGSPTIGYEGAFDPRDLGTVSGMGAGGLAQRVGEYNADLRARDQMDRSIGEEIARRTFTFDDALTGPVSNVERTALLANQALRTGAQILSPNTHVGAFRNPFGSPMPKSVLDQMWKTSTGQKMVPIFHGGSPNLKDVGWNPSQSPRYKGGWSFPEWGRTKQGWLAHATHSPQTAEIFKYGTDQTGAVYHGDVPLSEYRRGFQWSPIFSEPEIRLTGDDWNKAFEMAEYKDNPLAKLEAKTIHTPGRLARAVPFAGAALGAYDAGHRFALGDYAGAVLSGIGMIPGPIGWAGLGTQIAYDIIMAGINNGTFKTQQDIDESLGITGPPGIRGDF